MVWEARKSVASTGKPPLDKLLQWGRALGSAEMREKAGAQLLPYLHERAYHIYTHRHGPLAVQDRRRQRINAEVALKKRLSAGGRQSGPG